MMSALVFTRICHALAAGVLLLASTAYSQNYPNRPVRIIAAAPGAGADVFARQLAPRLSERWSQPVVIENRAGANSTIAGAFAARAAPDGYTLFMGDVASLATAVSLYKVSYDPVKDFSPVTLVVTAPLVLFAHPQFPASNLRELISYSKKHPGTVNYSSGSTGTPGHLTMALFAELAAINLVHVPYKGGGAALMAVVAREVQVAFASIAVVMPQIRAGTVKAYAVSARNRVAALPDVPTGPEAGVPGLESAAWFGIVAPARTPTTLIGKLNHDIVEILRTPALSAAFLAQGAESAPTAPQAFASFITSEIAKWKRVIEVSGARID